MSGNYIPKRSEVKSIFEKNITSRIDPILILEDQPLAMLREDLIHSEIPGNKWRKLKYNFLEMQRQGISRLVTFGGAFSNHIAATAACARAHGFESIGIIRGDELHPESNHTLRFAASCGMKLLFVSRTAYREKDHPDFLKSYIDDPETYYHIPEGGTNSLAIRGASEILDGHTESFDLICVAAGTGGTAAGIINSLTTHQKALIFPALKGSFIRKEIEKYTNPEKKYGKDWEIINRYHFGGYARWNKELIEFINTFKKQHSIPLDHIYNGKMMYGLHELFKNGYFRNYTSLLAVHTGGIQSIIGFNESNGNLIK